MKKKKKKEAPVFPREELERNPLVQAGARLDAAIDGHGQFLETYYEHLAQNPGDTSRDEDIQREIQGLKLASKELGESLMKTADMADELEARYQDARSTTSGRWLHRHATNATIDILEQRGKHFAQGLNPSKLMLLCVIGSFLGVVIEMLWCLITNGYIESRAGLVWGPFNLLYGVGAVTLTVCLYRFRNRGSWLSFLGGFLVGSVVEYACSWGQEMVFGSVSWDYSHMPLNLNGRICVLYSVFWGVLGVLWIKNIYPRMAGWILKLPNRAGKILTWSLAAFLAVDAVVSGVAVLRWSQRIYGTAEPGPVWSVVDQRFPDERMEKIYANMEFGSAK